MRAFPLVAVATLLISILPAVAPATGAGPLADAGASVAVAPGQAFALDGAVEGFAGAVSVAWAGPASCTIDDPSSLRSTARCSEPGLHAFTLAATDGASSATDSVVVGVSTREVRTLLQTTGTTLVPTASAGSVAGVRSFLVPPGVSSLTANLSWEPQPVGAADTRVATFTADLDLYLTTVGAAASSTDASRPAIVQVNDPPAGPWSADVRGYVAANTPWTLVVTAESVAGAPAVPAVEANGGSANVGDVLTLVADAPGAVSLAWETDVASRAFDDGAGETFDLTFTQPQLVRVKATFANGYEVVASALARQRGVLADPITVVAVIDGSFSPYHYDFLGSQHPWNLDEDASNDLDFLDHPSQFVPALAGIPALPITIPTSPNENVDALRTGTDAAVWAAMEASTVADPKPYWFPGTKVLAALKFTSGAFQSTNAAHGTASASVAAGNVHGSCPECLVVLINGNADAAIQWVGQQPWIDVVTNSYGAGGPVQANTLGLTRDNMYWKSPLEATKAASEDGQVIVFSAGNGFVNAFDVPMFTYWSSQKGPDWMVTVGAVDPNGKQTYSGAGKPVDISSIGGSYPASGGTTANGVGTHGGTSNAAPVTAGYFAKAIQAAREALGDLTPGHADGVVASGAPVACGPAVPACALGDGVLTRVELEDAVYASVLPTPVDVAADTIWPSTPLTYYYQGHGTLAGRIDDDATWEAEWTRIADHLAGNAPAYPRPAGEANWFVVDSKCRQHLWGAWSMGDYQGVTPALDPVADPIATAVDAWCTRMPEKPFLGLSQASGGVL